MKKEEQYAVYGTDTDGSERKFCTVSAKSEPHAMSLARQQGFRKVTCAVKV